MDVSTGGLDVDGQTDLDELQVAGVSTFSAKAVFNTAYPSIDADNEIQVCTAIQLGKAGVITATEFRGALSGTASIATLVTVTDNESTDEENLIAFVENAQSGSGNHGLEMDGNLTYNPSSGRLSATSFSGDGSNLTGIGTQGPDGAFRGITVAGISTFNDDVRITAGGLNVTGVVTATSFVGALTGTASNATNITVSANNGNNETVYPVFVDGATGSQGAETDTGLSYNPSTGALTATSFSGDGSNLTGIAATDHVSTFDLVVAGISTFNDDVRILAGGLDVTGVVTATSFSGDGSALTGIEAGGSPEFYTGITSSRQIAPLSFETAVFTFPSTSGRQYVIESINVANVDASVGVD